MISLFLKEAIKLHIDFRPLETYIQLIKTEKTISRRWTLKMAFLGDDKKFGL